MLHDNYFLTKRINFYIFVTKECIVKLEFIGQYYYFYLKIKRVILSDIFRITDAFVRSNQFPVLLTLDIMPANDIIQLLDIVLFVNG